MRRADPWAGRQKVLFRSLQEQLQQQSKQQQQQLCTECKFDAAAEPQDPRRACTFGTHKDLTGQIASKGL